MEEGLLSLLNTPGGVVGSSTAALITMAILLRKFYRQDKVEGATATGNVDMIQRLIEVAEYTQRQLEAANVRADKVVAEANARADTAYRERNEAMLKIGELTEQVRQLTSEVQQLQRKVEELQRQAS